MGETSLGIDDKIVSFVTVFFYFISSIIVLFIENQSEKVASWAWQTIILSVIVWIVWIILSILATILFRLVIFSWILYAWSLIVFIIWVISLILTVVKEDFVPYPIIGHFAGSKGAEHVANGGCCANGGTGTPA
eukprot:TRINITY_DN190_c0_g1_i1.p1 TRINITY_DN190_c0_g1~~TRINITY_DN190_c0_g1_i1.p1  ORF type:complete len:151 (-),score=24.10 TRINITY_DN190_c0_g1_i1:92-493(-)